MKTLKKIFKKYTMEPTELPSIAELTVGPTAEPSSLERSYLECTREKSTT